MNRSLNDEQTFKELCFCLCVPQSRAKYAWQAVELLDRNGLLYIGNQRQIAKTLKGLVRFHNTKARWIYEARELFTVDGEIRIKDILATFTNPHELRKWLVKNVNGMGYKLAGQFLRNVGIHQSFAILDVHVMKSLKKYRLVKIPKTLTPKRYLSIEKKMHGFAEKLGIPVEELDLLFWSEETGEVFK